ncbi:DMT family transporter [Pollutimonas thiosulfatoxidans]|uniref:EamA family transporter n=1 Tax=Pollutimonas thiosulfatoxidans TaxID=2028345 RepID=A0A410GBQ0_9BURK|nr:DMT family transporter [Pollutimonas thiosulfatoxidans]MBF6617866.1 DMT family transporter [Candidimonas sp.]NYT46089.1 DMT family transporter [Alcaligenaceae bacterium]QAA93714.1 EamA family transporter [Pollutimonas thiosulfatoxidans]
MSRQRALFSIHIAAVLFGLTGIFGELIQADAIAITAGRACFAVVALYAVMRMMGSSPIQGITRRNIGVLALAGAMLAIHWITFFIAVKISGVAIATLGFASFPAFITLCEWLVFKEKVSTHEWLILLLVSLGLVLVTPSFDFRDDATIGLAWAIASGLSFALFTLINRRAAARIPAQQVACWENAFVALLTLPFSLPAMAQLDALNWLWMAMLGVLCTALSHYLLVSSLMTLKARSAGIVIALEPVYAIFFAAVLFAQYPSLRALIGGALMVGAIIWSGLRKADKQAG